MPGNESYHMLMVQIVRAREALGESLGLTQEIGSSGLDLEALNRSLAGAVKELYLAEKEGLRDAGHVAEAMSFLRVTLIAMQDACAMRPSSNLDAATATVARTLAILFPVYKSLEAYDAVTAAPAAEAQPIPLTRHDGAPTPLIPVRKSASPSSPVDPGRERRGRERRTIEVDIGFQSETNFFTGFSMDISSGGLFVATFDIPRVGTPVNVNFRIPNGPIMSLDGVVRWIREYNEFSPETAPGMGIMFERLSPAEEDAINTYIARSAPLFFDS